jgi:hypothetical protein
MKRAYYAAYSLYINVMRGLDPRIHDELQR